MFVSMCLAIVSCIIVPPSAQYLQYIDFHTLILLFCLMLIVEGLREQGFFQTVGNWIFTRIKTTKGLVFSLVFLCFFSSMLITNDAKSGIILNTKIKIAAGSRKRYAALCGLFQ